MLIWVSAKPFMNNCRVK